MFITPLGHTECLIEIANTHGGSTRILVDSWLSDVCVSDLMSRRERVRINYKEFPQIDYLFISHSHLDHLDPYFLTEFFRHQSPTILLPETCLFARSILETYLSGVKIIILKNGEKFHRDGVSIEGMIWGSGEVSNEEDVMTLLVSNSDYALYHEIDTRVPFSEEAREVFEKKISQHRGKSLIFIESGNEIETQLRSLESEKTSQRNDIVKQAEDLWSEKISEEWQYLHDFELYDSRYELRSTRAWIGQGITIPREINEGLSRFHPLPLSRLSSIESHTLKANRITKASVALLPGKRYELERNGGLKEIPQITGLKVEAYNTKSDAKGLPLIERIPGSTFGSAINRSIDSVRILDLLNTRFIPFGLSSSIDPLKGAILASNDHRYRIAFQRENGEIETCFGFNWKTGKYEKEEKNIEISRISEIYWSEDMLDYLDGRQELYSTFVHHIPKGKSYRFWTILGANFINIDLLDRKLRYHFDRAAAGWGNRELNEELLKIYQRKIQLKMK